MLKNYFKIAWRNLIRNKRNSVIIISSLVIAFTFTNLLLSFIVYETNTDTFHHKKNRIYRVFSNDPMGGEKRSRVIMESTRKYISQHYPEVEQACNVTLLEKNGAVLGRDQQFFTDMMVLSVSPSFFKIFDYPFLEGSRSNALSHDGIVLSEETARKLFGESPFVNRNIGLRKDTTLHQLRVAAVISNESEPTQLEFDAVVSDIHYEVATLGSAFVLLKSGTNAKELASKINEDENVPGLIGPGNSTYSLESFVDTYFNQENVLPFERSRSSEFIWICWGVVFLISFAAGFNFLNLFVIGMTTRGKELGMRKILGASKGGIGFSICIEIAEYVIISFLFSLVLTIKCLPYFNTAFNTNLTLSYLTHIEVVGLIVSLILL